MDFQSFSIFFPKIFSDQDSKREMWHVKNISTEWQTLIKLKVVCATVVYFGDYYKWRASPKAYQCNVCGITTAFETEERWILGQWCLMNIESNALNEKIFYWID